MTPCKINLIVKNNDDPILSKIRSTNGDPKIVKNFDDPMQGFFELKQPLLLKIHHFTHPTW